MKQTEQALSYKDKTVTVIGLGKTGLSCVDFLLARGASVRVIDTREKPAGAEQLAKSVELHTGSLNADWLLNSDLIVASPGISIRRPELKAAAEKGVEIVGDIELFVREAKAPIIAITGSNGKSTVTTLTTAMAEAAGLKVGMGGNIGVPALSLLDGDYELFVLELSSFQLETTYSLQAVAATILNVSEDHMDRYTDLEDYRQAKLRIYQQAKNIIVNGEDPQTYPDNPTQALIRFAEHNADYSVRNEHLYSGEDALLPIKKLGITGRHNVMNALAASALAEAAGVPRSGILQALQSYTGLAHRFQTVPTKDGVRWVNDSKATNVGSTVAALNGLNVAGTLYLLLGGDGKAADFSELVPLVNKPNIVCYCFGQDREALAKLSAQSVLVETMHEAVADLRPKLNAGDMVLLSPACASLDQFKNFEERGDIFMALARDAQG